jgi:hypothetical protein
LGVREHWKIQTALVTNVLYRDNDKGSRPCWNVGLAWLYGSVLWSLSLKNNIETTYMLWCFFASLASTTCLSVHATLHRRPFLSVSNYMYSTIYTMDIY